MLPSPSRRKLLKVIGLFIAVLSIAFSCGVQARMLRGSSGSSAPSGNVNLNLAIAAYYQNVFPFINVMKTASQIEITNSNAPGSNYAYGVPQGAVDTNGDLSPYGSGLYLDTNGNFLSSLPSGNINWKSYPFILTGGGPPNYIGAGMTLDWQGGSSHWTISIVGSTTLATGTGTTPLTFTWPSATADVYVNISSDGTNANPPTNIRLYKTANATLINAGAILDPDYASGIESASWSARLMDIMVTNDNLVTTSINNFPALSNAMWSGQSVGGQVVGNQQMGLPLAAITGIANQTNKNPWINIPEGFATPKMSIIRSISNASTPVVTTYGPHNFSSGDTIYVSVLEPFAGPLLLNPSSYASSTFTATGSNILSNNAPIVFGILANGTTDSSTYPTGITKGTTYWTVNANTGAGTFQIATTAGGSALTLTGVMTGTINVLENNGTASVYGQLVIGSSYSASTFTLPSGTPISSNGTPVVFGASPTAPLNPTGDSSTYPSPINKGTTYYAVNVTGTTFQIASTPSGSPITLSGSQVGQINIFLQLAGNPFTVGTVSGNTFTLTGPGANTAGYVGKSDLLYAPYGSVFQPYNITTIKSVVGALASNIQTNLNSNLTPLFEFSNEWWNNQFSSNYFCSTMGQNTPEFLGSYQYACGYLMAAVADGVRISYGSGNRSKYKFIFSGSQTTADTLGGATGVAAGALQYLADNEPTLAITDLFDFLSMTTYTGSTSYFANALPSGWGAISATFSANTVAFANAIAGLPVKLTGASIPAALSTGALGTAGSGSISAAAFTATISGNVLNVIAFNGMSGSTITAGATIVSSNPDNISNGTTINAYGSGGTTGTGGVGTYQLSASQSTLSTATVMFTGTPFNAGTGPIYWTVGTGPNYGLATSPRGSPVTFGSGTGNVVICPTDVVEYLLQESLSLHASSPGTYPAPWTYYDAQISADVYNGMWTAGLASINLPVFGNTGGTVVNIVSRANYFITNYTAVGKPLAGLQNIGYEGGESNTPESLAGGFLLVNDPSWMSAYYETQFGAGSATNFGQIYTYLKQAGLIAHQAQYYDVGAFSIQYNMGDFGARQYIGDNNLRWQGIVNTNSLN